MDNSQFATFRQPDTSSVYSASTSPLQGSFEGSIDAAWPMNRTVSDFAQPQQPQRGSQGVSPYGQRLSIPQANRSTHRSPRQTSNQNAMSLHGLHTAQFTSPRSAPNPSVESFLRDTTGPFYAAKPNGQGARTDSVVGLGPFRESGSSLSDVGTESVPPLTTGDDSAYASQAPPSIYSDSQLHIPAHNSAQHFSHASSRPDDTRTVHSSDKSGHSRRRIHRSISRRHYVIKECEYCGDKPRCESDFKKHMLKHRKEHYCDVPGCPRQDAFGTINDLNRHLSTVHKLRIGSKSYQCAAVGCDKADKIWPRYDNFKQHVIRVHKDQHNKDQSIIDDICRRSMIEEPKPSPRKSLPDETMSMNNDLAGIGQGEPQTVDPSHMYNTEFLSSMSGLGPELQTSQDTIQGAAFLHQSLPRKSSSDRLNKAGQSGQSGQSGQEFSTSLSTDYLDGGIRKKRKLTPEKAMDVLADVAISSGQDTALKSKDPTAVNRETSHTYNATPGLKRPANPDGPTPLDQLIEQLKDRLGPEAFMNHLEQMSRDADPQSRKRPSPASSVCSTQNNPVGPMKCKTCHKLIARACDMKKHEKRHTKPYGCTFPHCQKVFGSKNDWKRHENSQHFQLEMWRCQMHGGKDAAPDGKCGQIFWAANILKKHLKKDHDIVSEPDQARFATEWRIGRSGHTRYWCGYCKNIIPVEGTVRGQAAWDERFNHIDCHIKDPECKRIHEWLCIEAKKLKGQATSQAESQKTAKSAAPIPIDDDDSSDNASADTTMPAKLALSHAKLRGVSKEHESPSLDVFIPDSMGMSTTQSAPVVDRNTFVSCCQCGSGPFNASMVASCSMNDMCDHPFCERCVYSYLPEYVP